MLIFGHKFIESKEFIRVNSISKIKDTKPNSVVLLKGLSEPFDMAIYCQKNGIEFGIEVNSIKEAIFANALGANYVVCEFNLAKELQNLADNYLWDMKILAIIESNQDIEAIAKAFVDGVIYTDSIRRL